MGTKITLMDGYKRVGSMKTCLYCGHSRGFLNGEFFEGDPPRFPTADDEEATT